MSSQYWYYLLDRIIGLEKHERITEDAQARMLKEAVQTSYRRAGEKPAKTWQKVAEITINLKTVKKNQVIAEAYRFISGVIQYIKGQNNNPKHNGI